MNGAYRLLLSLSPWPVTNMVAEVLTYILVMRLRLLAKSRLPRTRRIAYSHGCVCTIYRTRSVCVAHNLPSRIISHFTAVLRGGCETNIFQGAPPQPQQLQVATSSLRGSAAPRYYTLTVITTHYCDCLPTARLRDPACQIRQYLQHSRLFVSRPGPRRCRDGPARIGRCEASR